MNISLFEIIFAITICIHTFGNKALEKTSKKVHAYIDLFATGLLGVLCFIGYMGAYADQIKWAQIVCVIGMAMFLVIWFIGLIRAAEIPTWRNPRETNIQVGGR